jgi:DNA-binding NarL/FixJ family response regulator
VNILIADDHDIIRLGLKQLLESRSGWKICAEAATGTEAVTLAKQFEPHVVVMDIGMPELNGLEATRKICKLLPGTKIVVLTMHFSDQLVHDMSRQSLATNANGVLLRLGPARRGLGQKSAANSP